MFFSAVVIGEGSIWEVVKFSFLVEIRFLEGAQELRKMFKV